MIEKWKNIVGYYGKYQVSNKGRIKSLKRKKEKFLKIFQDKKGYNIVTLCKKSKQKTFRLSRLVAKTFIGNVKNKDVHHGKLGKGNDSVDNISIKKPIEHYSYHQKLNFEDAKMIRELYQTDFYLQSELGIMFDTVAHNISRIINNKRWRTI